MKRIYLEITNACNLNCPFCSNQKGHEYLSLADIDNFTSQIKPYCNYLYLHILGEPLLHPQFNEILNILDQKGFDLQLVTNGTLLAKYPDLLNHTCLRKLSISLHSINNLNVEEAYFKTINKIIEKNNQVKLELRFYDLNNLSNQLKDYLQQLKDKYSFKLTAKNNSYLLKENVYIYFEELFSWPNLKDPIINNYGKCLGGKNMLAINVHHKVTLCCLDPYAYNEIGDLDKNSFKEIINSDKYQKYLKDLSNNKINLELCQKCSYRLRFTR